MRSLIFFLAVFGRTLKVHTDLNDSNWGKRTRRESAYTTLGDNFFGEENEKKGWRAKWGRDF